MSLLQNPFFNAGMNILAANKGSALQPIGQGVIGAQQQMQHNQLLQQRQQLEQEQQETLRKYRELQTRQLEYEMNKPPERKFIKDSAGLTYDQSTMERVFPHEQPAPLTNIGKLRQEQSLFAPGSVDWQYREQAIQNELNKNLPTGMTRGDDGQPQYMPQYIAAQKDMRNAGRAETNVNVNTGSEVGTIPPNYELFTDPQTGARHMRLIPGSPADMEIADAKRREDEKRESASVYAGVATRDALKAIEAIDGYGKVLGAGGRFGGAIRTLDSMWPGSPTNTAERYVNSVLNTVTVDTLNRQRDQSPAGASGFGNLSDGQMKVLQGILGEYHASLPPDDQVDILNRIYNFYLGVELGTPEERAQAVRDGRMTQAESDQIDSYYRAERRGPGGRLVEQSEGVGQDDALREAQEYLLRGR